MHLIELFWKQHSSQSNICSLDEHLLVFDPMEDPKDTLGKMKKPGFAF